MILTWQGHLNIRDCHRSLRSTEMEIKARKEDKRSVVVHMMSRIEFKQMSLDRAQDNNDMTSDLSDKDGKKKGKN